MRKITEKSYARITLALDIIKKNTEGEFTGFHELGIIKHQINLFDEISICDSDELKIVCNDSTVPTDEKNICWKVVELIKEKFNIDKNILIEIKKNIPAQGGLAGGSSNAAITLNLLNVLWDLNLSFDEKVNLGQKVGMDVPFFFVGGTVFDSESGGVLRKIETDAKFNFVIVLPYFGVSTPEAYGNLDYSKIAKNFEQTDLMEQSLLNNDFENIHKFMHNDFEISVFKSHPKLQKIKDILLNLGAKNVVMSGSGSTLIGLVDNEKDALKICNKMTYRAISINSL